jgi:hypothetical protein
VVRPTRGRATGVPVRRADAHARYSGRPASENPDRDVGQRRTTPDRPVDNWPPDPTYPHARLALRVRIQSPPPNPPSSLWISCGPCVLVNFRSDAASTSYPTAVLTPDTQDEVRFPLATSRSPTSSRSLPAPEIGGSGYSRRHATGIASADRARERSTRACGSRERTARVAIVVSWKRGARACLST